MSVIVELKAENFKGLRAVRVRADGKAVALRGRNGAGKSSVLDAIEAALGGAQSEPQEPIRRGAKRAEVVVDLGDLCVRKTWTHKGRRIEVTGKDGVAMRSPQEVLDKLAARLTLDPLAFARMDARAQGAKLREALGVDTSGVDADRARIYEQRTQEGRERDRASGAAQRIMVPADAPNDALGMAELLAEHRRTVEANTAHEAVIQRARAAAAELAKAEADLRRADEALAEAQAERGRARLAAETAASAAAAAPALVDTAAIEARMRDAERLNTAVRLRQERARLDEEVREHVSAIEDMTDRLSAIDEQKRDLLAGAASKLAIDGLSLAEDGTVTYRGVPLTQASQGEQLRVSAAVAAATAGDVRVMLVREGSVLDADGRRMLAELAEEHGLQLWMEVIDRPGEIGVLIEDGEVAGEPAKADAVAPAPAGGDGW